MVAANETDPESEAATPKKRSLKRNGRTSKLVLPILSIGFEVCSELEDNFAMSALDSTIAI